MNPASCRFDFSQCKPIEWTSLVLNVLKETLETDKAAHRIYPDLIFHLVAAAATENAVPLGQGVFLPLMSVTALCRLGH
jgi:hypothetical protein